MAHLINLSALLNVRVRSVRPWEAEFALPLRPPTSASHFGLPLRPPTLASHFGPPTLASHFGLPLPTPTWPHTASQFGLSHGLPIRPLTASHGLSIWPLHGLWHGLITQPFTRPLTRPRGARPPRTPTRPPNAACHTAFHFGLREHGPPMASHMASQCGLPHSLSLCCTEHGLHCLPIWPLTASQFGPLTWSPFLKTWSTKNRDYYRCNIFNIQFWLGEYIYNFF